jgi:antitoxin CptB
MDQLARLKWQCRRGTKELDLLLQRYLETDYLLADEEEKAQFVELLALEDDELLAVLMGGVGSGNRWNEGFGWKDKGVCGS